MTPLTARPPASEETAAVTITQIEEVLKKLTPEQLADVLQFVLFLQYKPMLLDDAAEDEALWQAVQAHQTYKDSHPDEQPEVYNNKEALEEALASL